MTPPLHGTTSINSVTGAITYTPNTGYSGSDVLTYRICDTTSPVTLCDTADVVITVTPVNETPIAQDDTAATTENTPVIIPVVTNDYDTDRLDTASNNLDYTTLRIITGPTHTASTPTINTTTGAITYVPANGYAGSDTFTYEICDTTGQCDTALVTVTIDEGSPNVVSNTAGTTEEVPVTITILSNDTDPQDNINPLSVRLSLTISGTYVSVPAGTTFPTTHGTVEVLPDGRVIYTPNPDYDGIDTFFYEVCDTDPTVGYTPLCGRADVVVTITKNLDDDAPVAVPDARTTPEDTPVTIAILENDSDADGDVPNNLTLTFPDGINGLLAPTLGTMSYNPTTHEVTYTPNLHANGTDTFEYTLCDTATPTPHCDTTTVTVIITPVEDTPVAQDDTITGDEDTSLVVNIFSNDTDPENNISMGSVFGPVLAPGSV